MPRHHLGLSAEVPTTPIIDHWVLQLRGVAASRIDEPETVREAVKSCARALKLTCVSEHSHYFGPGVSTVLILSESHLSVHTWPELGYVHVDIVTCVKKLTGKKLESVFKGAFLPAQTHAIQLQY